MDEQTQIEIPQSFMALYCKNGSPFESRSTIEARYDICEDLAIQMGDFCRTLQFKEDLSEDEVLLRCHAGLRASSDVLDSKEAGWVTLRTAELLGWGSPDFLILEAGQ